MTPDTAQPEATIDQSVFEGLFLRQLEPTGDFARELAAAGYDAGHPLPRYPGHVWAESVRIACRHAYRDLPEDRAMFLLGERYLDGFLHTAAGKLISGMARFMSPGRTVANLARFASMARTDVELIAVADGPNAWQLRYHQAEEALPHFVHGILSRALRQVGFVRIELISAESDRFVVRAVARD